MTNEDDVYMDTAVWSDQRWFVRGHPSIPFTSEKDARHALQLAGAMKWEYVNELADKIRAVLP